MKEIKIKSNTMKEIKLNTTTKTLKEEMYDSLLNDSFYDFISNNYYKFDKEELVCIIKNYDYTRYQLENNTIEKWQFIDQLIENLNDYDFFEEE